MERVISHIRFMSRSRFRMCSVVHGNGTAMIMFFAESDGRKRMRDSIASVEDMDRVREALMLPEGTKPKWYNCHGCDEHDNAADSSEDEARPVGGPRIRAPPLRDASEYRRTSDSAQDSDESMASDSDYEDDSDESTSGSEDDSYESTSGSEDDDAR